MPFVIDKFKSKNGAFSPISYKWGNALNVNDTRSRAITPLYTYGFFLLVWYNKLWTVYLTYLEMPGYNFQKESILLSEDHFTL